MEKFKFFAVEGNEAMAAKGNGEIRSYQTKKYGTYFGNFLSSENGISKIEGYIKDHQSHVQNLMELKGKLEEHLRALKASEIESMIGLMSVEELKAALKKAEEKAAA